ncbi:MAG: hypothetical protein ACKVQC_05045 [Elusimicrobiota bacterium]
MAKLKEDNRNDMSVEALMLTTTKDKYKLAFSAIRWAREIKKAENSTESMPTLINRAMKEIILGKVTIKEIEKLPLVLKAPTPHHETAPAGVVPVAVASETPADKLLKSKD